jgi:hypothetical protein
MRRRVTSQHPLQCELTNEVARKTELLPFDGVVI